MNYLYKFILLPLLLLVAQNATAQLILTSDTTVCPGTTITLQAQGSTSAEMTFTDDVYSPTIELPFGFNFYGNTFNLISISSNGYIQFRTVPTTATGDYSSYSITSGIPGNPNVLNSAMCFYADLDPRVAGATIQYSTVGTAPNRKFIVTFCNVAMYSVACNALKATFQTILHEGTNLIEYQIQNAPNCPTWQSGRAIQGIQNNNGTKALATPGRNYPTAWSASNDGRLFSPTSSLDTPYVVSSIPFNFMPVGPNIEWYKNGTTLVGTGANLTITVDEPAFYVAVPTAAGPCLSGAEIDTVYVGTYNTLAPTVSSVITYCEDAAAVPLTATAEPGAVLYWYTSDTGGTPTTVAPVPETSVPGSTTYWVSAFKNGCESIRRPITVSVLAAPAGPAVVSPVIYCQNEPAVALAATGPNIKWYTSPVGGIASTVAPVPNTAVAGTTTYYVSQTNSSGCESHRTPVVVVVHPTPALPATAATVNYCQNEPATALTATGTNLLWYKNPTGGSGVTTAPVPATGTPGTFNWYVSQTIDGCEGPRAHITVHVYETPAPPVVSDLTICQNEQPPAAWPVTGSNLLWYTAASGGTGSATAPSINTSTPHINNYYVSQTVNGCESARVPIRLTVNPQVKVDFELSKFPLCTTDTITVRFTGIAPSTADFTWTLNNTTLLSGDLNGPGPLTVYWNSATSASIRLDVSNLTCSDTKTIDFTVGQPELPDFELPDYICLNQPANIRALGSSVGASTYFWEVDGGNAKMGSNNEHNLVSWNTPGIKTVTLSFIKDYCQSFETSKTILVRDLPAVQILDRQQQPACEFDTVTFRTTPVPGYQYAWLPSEYVLAGQGTPTVVMLAKGPKDVSVMVTDTFGCMNVTEVPFLVEPCCNISMPTAFTPNGDGRNDIFRMTTKGHQPVTYFRVYNRWGQTVFESRSQYAGWDGTINGAPAPMDTYFYILQYNCEGRQQEVKGDVILVR